jgi:hypothetical protein
MPTVPDIHRRGTRAAQATLAAPPLTVGTLYFVTDEGVTERWTGTAWESYSAPSGVGTFAPLVHAARHQAGGADPIALDTLAAPTDVATLNASASAHGLLRKLSGTATQYLDGSGAWSTPAGGGGAPAAHHASHETGGSDAIAALSGAVITTGTVAAARLPPRIGAVGIVIDGGGSVITTGVKGFVEVPFACTITAVTLLSTDAAVTSGSIVIDIWKDSYANYAPTIADTITASAKPTLASAIKSRDTTLTGWTTAIAAGDILGFSVTSVTALTRVALSLTVQA